MSMPMLVGVTDESKQIGSRNGDNVANAYWNSDKFNVNSNDRRNRNPDNGGREEVSRKIGIVLFARFLLCYIAYPAICHL